MRRIIRILMIIAALSVICSCTKSRLEALYNKQESQIDTYLTNKGDSYRIVRNGSSNRLVTVEGTGEELAYNGNVSFYYAGYTFSGSYSANNMFITNHEATATQAGWDLTDAEYELYEINLRDTELIQGLKDGLVGVKAGEECEIIFSGKFGFGNKVIGTIPANSALLYKIWVVAVSND